MDDREWQRLHDAGYRNIAGRDPYRAKDVLVSCGIMTYLVADGERTAGLAPSWAAAIYEAFDTVDGGFDYDLDLGPLKRVVEAVKADAALRDAISTIAMLDDRARALRRFLVQQDLITRE